MTPGSAIDYSVIEKKIKEVHREHPLIELVYDQWNARDLVQRLEETERMTCVECIQGMKSLTGPAKFLERLVLEKRLRHGGHPILTWNAENTQVYVDNNENYRPVKGKNNTKKIDGIMATIDALSRAMFDDVSVYERRGMLEM